MGAHLSGLLGLTGIPLASILGPLIVWLLKRNDFPSVDAHGKQALNFQISAFIYAVIASVLILILVGFVLVPLVIIYWLVFTIINAIRASDGREVHYPGAIPFFR